MPNAYLLAGIAMVLWGVAPLFGKLGIRRYTPVSRVNHSQRSDKYNLLITVTA